MSKHKEYPMNFIEAVLCNGDFKISKDFRESIEYCMNRFLTETEKLVIYLRYNLGYDYWDITKFKYFDKELKLPIHELEEIERSAINKFRERKVKIYYINGGIESIIFDRKYDNSGISFNDKISVLDLPIRIDNALGRAGYRTIGDLWASFHPDGTTDLSRVRGIGKQSIDIIISSLNDHGIQL